MRTKLLMLFVLLNAYSVFSQNSSTLTGSVKTCDGSPIDVCTITILSAEDMSILGAFHFYETYFEFPSPDRSVVVVVTSLGCEELRIPIRKGQSGELDVCLKKTSVDLDAVSVSSIPPVFSVQNDKLVIHASQTVLGQAGSAIDLLRTTAKIKIDEKFGIFVGTDVALIFVDGREVTDMKVLDMLPSNEVEDVEIITNPSAVYDAKARAIINVTTKKTNKKGVDIALTGRMAKAEYWNQYFGADVKATLSNLSLYASYSFSPTKKFFQETYGRDLTIMYEPPIMMDVYIQNELNTTYNTDNKNNIRLGGEYTILKNHKVGAEFTYQKEDEATLNRNRTKMSLANAKDFVIMDTLTQKRVTYDRDNVAGTLYYTYSNSSGLYFNATFDANSYSSNASTDIALGNNPEKTKVKNNLKGVRIDANIPLPHEFKLNAGLKHSYIHNTSDYNLLKVNEDETIKLDYNHKDKISAAYLILSRQFGKLNAKVGLRAEYTDNFIKTDNSSSTKYNLNVDTTYWNVFPNVILDYKVNPKINISATYRMSIHRPTFGQLNPSPNYVDPGFYMSGNPALKVEKRHNFMLKFNYKKYSIAFSHVKSKNGVIDLLDQDDNDPLVSKLWTANVKRSNLYTIDVIIPYNTDFINTFLYTGLIYSRYKDTNIGINLSRPLWYASLSTDFKLPYKVELNTNYRYFTKGLYNAFYFKPVFRMDASLRRKFLDNKLTATLLWNDVFHSDKMKTHTKMNGHGVSYNYDYDLSIISFAVSYNFKVK